MNEQFKYDVFISHSAQDKPAVRELAERLRRDGLRVWPGVFEDEWEIKPGDASLLKIQAGLEQARTLVLMMSGHVTASEWVTFERYAVLFRDPTNQQRRLVPVRLDDAEVKDTLRQFAYVAWRQHTDAEYGILLDACRPLNDSSHYVLQDDLSGKKDTVKVIRGHQDVILGIAVTPNGEKIVSGDEAGEVRIWNLITRRFSAIKYELEGEARAIALSQQGNIAVVGSSGYYDGGVNVFHLASAKKIKTLDADRSVIAVAVDRAGNRVVWGTYDGLVRCCDLKLKKRPFTLGKHPVHDVINADQLNDFISGVAIDSDGNTVVSTSGSVIKVWDVSSRKRVFTLSGHTEDVNCVAVTSDGKVAVTGSSDQTLRIWDLKLGKCTAVLEGHRNAVNGVAITPDGRIVASASHDETVRVWDLRSGACISVFKGHNSPVTTVALTRDGQTIISGGSDKALRVWSVFCSDVMLDGLEGTTRYTNAKILLVGENGVGKSGLALRLTKDRFEPTISTDGATVTRVTEEWATQLKLPYESPQGDIEREIWLWDFAGQADYRLIHQLFMDETSLAVLVFNPQTENPFEGLGQWDRDLQRAARRKFQKLLVGGRCDRGGLMVSRESIDRFRAERGFAEYLETSAQTGSGCDELRNAIIHHIPWDDIPWTGSPRIFKLLKEEIIRFRDEGIVLLRTIELKQQLEMRLIQESFTLEDLRTVIRLLAGPGVVWQLEFGDFVLLQPERINAYAAAVIRSVRAHTDEIGCISEARVLAGDLDYQDMKRLPHDEEQIVLRAMHQTFVDHGLCLRESTEVGTLLVFPSYFKRDRLDQGEHPLPLVTYQFDGMLDEIYATLVVRLLHSKAVEKDQLWRFAADFKTLAGQRVGLKLTRKPEGAAEITVYCEPDISVETKAAFIRYVQEHLKAKDPDVKRERHYVCGHCQSAIEDRQAVQKRLKQGIRDILCVNCEKRVLLWDLIEEKFASEETQRQVREMDEQARRAIDNESRELILLGHAFAIAGEAGQIFRPTPNSDWGIDGEIEFKNDKGEASGRRVYLQLKSGDSYLETRQDGREVFKIKKARHAEYWTAQEYPVMLVIRTSEGGIRWMNVTEYLQKQSKVVKQIVFDGEPFTAQSLWRLRDRVLR
jgi:small GTP-binding protein